MLGLVVGDVGGRSIPVRRFAEIEGLALLLILLLVWLDVR
jgi:hypothetical protein